MEPGLRRAEVLAAAGGAAFLGGTTAGLLTGRVLWVYIGAIAAGLLFVAPLTLSVVPKRKSPEVPIEDEPPGLAPSRGDDAPIQSEDEDALGRAAFARRLTQSIVTRAHSASVVVGLYGPWGSGKSSVLNLSARQLSNAPQTVVVRFSPWYFETDEQLIRSFFATLAEKMGTRLESTTAQIASTIAKYGQVLAPLTFSAGVPGMDVSADLSGVTALAKELSTSNLDEMRDRVNRAIRKSGLHFVVVIDDIDRLDAAQIHAMLKLVKMAGYFDQTTYVLAFDEHMVATSIGDRYGGTEESREAAGRAFLEKIVQVPISVPPADGTVLFNMLMGAVAEAFSAAGRPLDAGVQANIRFDLREAVGSQITTPRHVKRLANALEFSVPLLAGEVDPRDLVFIEATRISFPEFYSFIPSHPEIFIGSREGLSILEPDREQGKTKFEAALGKLPEEAQIGFRRALDRTFPALARLAQRNVTFAESNYRSWAEQQKLASPVHFPRYFQYSLLPGDIPDVLTTTLIADLAGKSEDVMFERLSQFAAEHTLLRLVGKLDLFLVRLPVTSVENFTYAMARLADNLPRDYGRESSGIRRDVAFLLERQIARLDSEQERDAVAKNAASRINQIPLAIDLARYFKAERRGDDDERGILSIETEQELISSVIVRIVQEAQNADLIDTYGDEALTLFLMWERYGEGQPDVREHVGAMLALKPGRALDLLRSAARTATIFPGARPQLGPDYFNSITKLASPEAMEAALNADSRIRTVDLGRKPVNDMTDDEYLAWSFLEAVRRARKHDRQAGSDSQES